MTEGRGSYIKTECGRNILDLTCGSQSPLSLLLLRPPLIAAETFFLHRPRSFLGDFPMDNCDH